MNRLPVYLYYNKFEVIFDLDQNRGIHKIMYQRPIKIQKGFKDSIQIQFKNSDQKPMPLSNTNNFWFDMIDTHGRQLVLTKQLEVLDDTVEYNVAQSQTSTNNTLLFTSTVGISIGQSVTGFGVIPNTVVTNISGNVVTLSNPTKYAITTSTTVTFSSLSLRGIAVANFDPIDTINIAAGSYRFLIKQDNNDGTFTPAYASTYYRITGEVEVVEDGFPIGFPVQTVTAKQLEAGVEYDRNPEDLGYTFYSGWLRPFPNALTTSTPQSVQFSLSNFAGTITVQGTLDNNPSSSGQANAQAFDITTYTVTTPTQGNVQLTWDTSLVAVRFVVKPKQNAFGINFYPTGNPIGSNLNRFPSGFVDLIQYFS